MNRVAERLLEEGIAGHPVGRPVQDRSSPSHGFDMPYDDPSLWEKLKHAAPDVFGRGAGQARRDSQELIEGFLNGRRPPEQWFDPNTTRHEQ